MHAKCLTSSLHVQRHQDSFLFSCYYINVQSHTSYSAARVLIHRSYNPEVTIDFNRVIKFEIKSHELYLTPFSPYFWNC